MPKLFQSSLQGLDPCPEPEHSDCVKAYIFPHASKRGSGPTELKSGVDSNPRNHRRASSLVTLGDVSSHGK